MWEGIPTTATPVPSGAAQQSIITEDQYVSCRSKETVTPVFEWAKVLGVKEAKASAIPGTDRAQDAKVVTAQLTVGGVPTSVSVHMFYEDGLWRWSMTKENVAGCRS